MVWNSVQRLTVRGMAAGKLVRQGRMSKKRRKLAGARVRRF